jgi:hypothetical protein
MLSGFERVFGIELSAVVVTCTKPCQWEIGLYAVGELNRPKVHTYQALRLRQVLDDRLTALWRS